MKNVASTLSGRILFVAITVGSEVKPGDELFKIESMKMEIPVEAEQAGRVIQVLVREGDEVQEGQDLAILG